MWNKLLQEQIQKHLGSTDFLSDSFTTLFREISESYDYYETDRKTLKRSIDISSNELTELNNQLRKEILELEKAKKVTIESSANLNAIINNTDDSIFSVDREYNVLSANDTFIGNVYKLTGSRIQPGDYFFIKEAGEERIKEWKQYIDRALNGEHFKIETEDRLEGRVIYAEISFNPIKEGETVIGVGCFSRNVTRERINAEQLKASEIRFRSLIESSHDMLTVLDAEGIIEYVSPAVERILGYSNEENSIRTVMDDIHPDDLKIVEAKLLKVLEHPGVPVSCTIRNKCKDGNYLWVEGAFTNLLHVPDIHAIVGNFRDITEKKLAKETLQKSEANLRTILNNADTGYVLLDKELKAVYFNQHAQKFAREELHCSLEEGGYACDFFPTERKNVIREVLSSVLKGNTVAYEINYVQPDQSERWYYAKYFPVSNEEGAFGVILSLTEFTERKLTQQRIKESNDRYELATKATNDAIWDWNLLTDELYWSEGYRKNFGYHDANEERSIRTWVQRIHPLDRTRVREGIRVAIDNPNIDFWQDEYRFITKDGSITRIYDRAYIVYDEDKKPIRMVGAMQNITERKKTEEALQKSERQLREISSSIPGIVYQFKLDSKGNSSFPYISDGIHALLGISPAELYKDADDSFKKIHPDDLASFKQSIGMSAATMEPWLHLFRVSLPNGKSYKWIRGNSVPRKLEDGSILWNGTMIDITESKQNEEALIESEKYNRNLFDQSTVGLALAGMDGTLVDVNEAYAKIIGRSQEECKKLTYYEITPEVYTSQEEERLEELRTTGRYGPYEKEYIHKKGHLVPVRLSGTILEKNGVKYIWSSVEDITDSKTIEEQLKYSESLLSEAQQLAKVGNWNFDLKKNEIFWSSGTRATYGVDNDFIPSFEAFISMIHPEDKERVVGQIKTAEQTGKTVDHEFRIIRKDGQMRVLNGQTRFTLNGDGKPLRIFGISQDITELKMAEETLRRSEANLRTIFDNTKTSYILLDAECRIQSFNPVAALWAKEALDITLKEGATWWTYFPERLQKSLKEKGKSILKGNTLKEEVRFLQTDAAIHYYETEANPVLNNEGNVLGICIVLNDITERKLSELEREKMTVDILQRNKNLEQFSYIVSHNLRAPVANIMGISMALQEEESDEETKADLQEGLFSSAMKLDEVIMDLNNILQIKHEISERKETVLFSKLSNDIYLSIRSQLEASKAIVKWNFSEVEEMLTLKSYLQSIFYNLIFNSVKYRQPNRPPVIEISSHRKNNKIELLFRDNCMGIDLQKNGDQVFGLYKRFHDNEVEGKGLGLFMVKTQVEAIGGKISVVSEVNIGTEFKIEFEA